MNQPVNPIEKELSDRLFDEERMYAYIEAYAAENHMEQTMRVLPYAREKHSGQFRKGKDKVPYIYHPLLVACQALALGLDDDNMVSAALLHDVCEDCDVAPEELPVKPATQKAVALLTKVYVGEKLDKAAYFGAIAENEIAVMVKLLDRCCNVSGMAAGFTREKMLEYIEETEQWFYPMIQSAKTAFPEHSNALFLLKYHISSVVETIKHLR